MTLIYCDASALLRRVFDEDGSTAVNEQLSRWTADGAHLVSSVIARVEVCRALARRTPSEASASTANVHLDQVIGDIGLFLIDDDVLHVASELPSRHLGTLDAIHVATALLSDADLVFTRDDQMIRACRELGLAVA